MPSFRTGCECSLVGELRRCTQRWRLRSWMEPLRHSLRLKLVHWHRTACDHNWLVPAIRYTMWLASTTQLVRTMNRLIRKRQPLVPDGHQTRRIRLRSRNRLQRLTPSRNRHRLMSLHRSRPWLDLRPSRSRQRVDCSSTRGFDRTIPPRSHKLRKRNASTRRRPSSRCYLGLPPLRLPPPRLASSLWPA